MKCRPFHIPVWILSVAVVAAACGPARKLAGLSEAGMSAQLGLPADMSLPQLDTLRGEPVGDTLRVTGIDGREVLIMKAIRDDETGDMVPTEELNAAVVSVRFRNVAERNGKISLQFQITVPAMMRDSHWQLRLHPDLFAAGDSLRMDDIVVTGEGFRRLQMRGYGQYGRYENRIVTDSTEFIYKRALGIFMARNVEMNYTTPIQAEDHYTNHMAKNINESRKLRLPEMKSRFVRLPLLTEGVRLDTVIVRPDGDFEYDYVQIVNTRPGLRKIDVRMSGEIFDGERKVYTMPYSDPLTFYVSSLSSFADMADHYKVMILSREVSANMSAVIDFERGSSRLDLSLRNNGTEMNRVRETLRSLLCGEEFVVDSIVVSAFASPEGSMVRNNSLSFRRAKSATDCMKSFASSVGDSLRRIDFLSRSGGENWALLDELVEADSLLSSKAKSRYGEISRITDPDIREKRLSEEDFYPEIRDRLFPSLRRVRFDFHLHRSGMVKDTVHTNVIDTNYMEGVRALVDHDYKTALERLAEYQDYNTAVAMVALDRNISALSILVSCPKTAQVNYMLALVHSRLGDERSAVEYYIRSCGQEPSYIHRGNLDPEISALVKKYDLNTEKL